MPARLDNPNDGLSPTIELCDGVEGVFRQEWTAVQRSARTALSPVAIQVAGVLRGTRAEGDDRVQPRAGLVVGLDAIDVAGDQLFGRDRTGGHGFLQLGDALLGDVERTAALCPRVPQHRANCRQGRARDSQKRPSFHEQNDRTQEGRA